MSSRPAQACRHPRCPCQGTVHGRAISPEQDAARKSRRWKVERAAFLSLLPNRVCRLMVAKGCRGRSDTVHHKVAPKGNMYLFWDHANWLSACGPCNNAHALQAEGGFRGSWHSRRTT